MDVRLYTVMLSIISRQASAGIIYTPGTEFMDLLDLVENCDYAVQEHLVKLYGADPCRAAGSIVDRCNSDGISIVTVWDDEYPPLLREIYMPPLVLYYRGSLVNRRHIAIVGTRASDSCSNGITRRVAGALAEKGITVVSGLAVGIDRNAHIGTLGSGGTTVAVLPQGVDVITPAANRDIYQKIIESGKSAVLSEYPPGVKSSDKWTFARRNRIISGMSEAVIIIQAPVKSGAMITARYALEQNRELYVCPGNAFNESYGGCHYLIKQGATMLTDIDEFLYNIDPSFLTDEKPETRPLSLPGLPGQDIAAGTALNEYSDPVALTVAGAAGDDWKDIDEIARSTGIPVEKINMAITVLEISGQACRRGNRIKIISRKKDFSGL